MNINVFDIIVFLIQTAGCTEPGQLFQVQSFLYTTTVISQSSWKSSGDLNELKYRKIPKISPSMYKSLQI